jgi:hypothetical protein
MKGMIRAGVMRRPRRLLVRLARVGDSKRMEERRRQEV